MVWMSAGETGEVHTTVTKPFIDSIGVGAIQWVYNILEGKSTYMLYVQRVVSVAVH